ncbi:peptidoglycan DD-metalloendopeptidase family protein [Anabaena sp. UHCC 0187]|uniref:M23 family metallopeptidase n=1 Tax=Anabaena sp. UHCC 0187 TaxID=2590018 RepID=UPI001446107C|nr:peptidoglycan DD-metalloendopeptidase family protein [Anabaena sp. UHCC 0187]MDP5016331.1 peptidoglycan DD-metalloendopeptidase family protein [Dolichospermum sp.]MTJ11220.1 peptidoglycan DD-metalloendopeptidase family protein [Anabaena sp. UHCC 0187]
MKRVFFQKISLWWLFLISCALVWSIVILLPVSANSINTLQQQQQQVQQQRQNVIQEQNRLTNLQIQAQKHLSGLNQNLQATNSYIQDSELRLQQATQLLQQLEANLTIAERDYENRQMATVERLRFLQRSPTSQGWAVLLQSQNINDFISRRYRLKLVYQADQRILARLSQQANLLIQQRTEVAGQKNQIALIREQLLAQKADYQTQAQSQTELVQRLNNDRLALEAAQNQLDKDSQNLTVLIQEKIAQQQRIAAQQAREAARAKTASKNVIIPGTGIFAFPSDAPTSSPFGWRVHPILGYRRFHAGLDFAASYGSTIRAADSGTVIFAGWYGGYGKAVIISHSKGITTLYGHASELSVSEGQTVQKGQPIALVGSTGFSTGPHLHFEVRRDGTPVDPANYL